jgi:hypothetical protein
MDLSQDVMNELTTECGYTLVLYSSGQINCRLSLQYWASSRVKNDLDCVRWDRYVVPKRRQVITTTFALEDETDRLSRNVGKELPFYGA